MNTTKICYNFGIKPNQIVKVVSNGIIISVLTNMGVWLVKPKSELV